MKKKVRQIEITGVRPVDTALESVMQMIEDAGRKIGADVHWHGDSKVSSIRFCSIRFCATLTLSDCEVMVEAVSPKLGAKIESDDGGRSWNYNSADSLAKAISSRARAAKVRDARDAARADARRVAEALELEACKRAETSLKVAFGDVLVDTCVTFRAHCVSPVTVEVTEALPVVTLHIDVTCGKIRGEKMDSMEAARFIGVLIAAGYDPAREDEKRWVKREE